MNCTLSHWSQGSYDGYHRPHRYVIVPFTDKVTGSWRGGEWNGLRLDRGRWDHCSGGGGDKPQRQGDCGTAGGVKCQPTRDMEEEGPLPGLQEEKGLGDDFQPKAVMSRQ